MATVIPYVEKPESRDVESAKIFFQIMMCNRKLNLWKVH